jgi:hypothetical protein
MDRFGGSKPPLAAEPSDLSSFGEMAPDDSQPAPSVMTAQTTAGAAPPDLSQFGIAA